MSKKRILFVINNFQIGGVQKSLINLLREISDEYDITVYTFSIAGAYSVDLPRSVKVIEAVFPLNMLGISLQQARVMGHKSYVAKLIFGILARIFGGKLPISYVVGQTKEIGHFDYAISFMHPGEKNMFYGGTNEFVVKKVRAKEKIAFIHADFMNYGGDIPYAKKLYMGFDKLVFCSEGCMESFQQVIPRFSSKTCVVHNCHDILKIKEQSRDHPVVYADGIFNIVLVSRVTLAKGIDAAIYAIQDYVTRFSKNICLHIIGDGADKEYFEKIVQELSLEENISFYGSQKNPYRYMINADLLLLTSRHEAAPMVFDEAQILKLPILATPSTSTSEMIIDRQAGWVCENDPKKISSTLDLINRSGKRSLLIHDFYNSSIEEFKIMLEREVQ